MSNGYTVGERDFTRGWGGYVVTAVGTNDASEEFCEKDITVRPAQALSLQSHDLRREMWSVTSGELTVVLDGRRLTLQAGDSIRIPLGGIHCMANLSQADCIVHEVQEGLCREDDIHRYADMYGRSTEKAGAEKSGGEKSEAASVASSLSLYFEILNAIGFKPAAPTVR